MTGSSRGIGAATARLLAAHGARVAVNYVANREQGQQVVADIERKLTSEAKASFFACQAVVPGMIARRRGAIVNVSSGLSRVPGPGFIALLASHLHRPTGPLVISVAGGVFPVSLRVRRGRRAGA